MNCFEWFGMSSFDWQFVSAKLSLTLLHFLWQGLTVALVVVIAFRMLRNSSASIRYLVAFSALVSLPAISFATFALVDVPTGFSSNLYRPDMDSESSDSSPGGNLPATSHNSSESIGQLAPDIAPSSPHDSMTADSAPSKKPMQPSAENTRPASWSLVNATMPWLSAIYVLGVGIMLLRLLLTVWRGSRLRCHSTLATDPELTTLVNQLAKQMRLTVAPVVYYCEQVVVPAVIGVWKPAVLLPISLATNLTPTELAAILSHELAHIRRFDTLTQLAQKVIESLFFFHPVVWWLSRQVSSERENCCDDLAAASGIGNVGYAAALLRLAELCLPSGRKALAQETAALSADGKRPNQLSRRIERQLKTSNVSLTPARLLPVACVFMLLVGITSIAVYASATGAPTHRDVESPTIRSENAMADPANQPVTKNEKTDLAKAIENFNQQNRQQELGLDQPPVTEEEVVAAIVRSERERDAPRLNEQEFETLKSVAENRGLPEDAYFYVYTSQQTEPFTVRHFWHVQLFLPAIGHDGFVPFSIRKSKFADETIDPADIAWGQPDEDGLKLGCYLSPKQETYQSGEKVRLRLFVQNEGTRPVKSTWAWTTHPMLDDFTIVDEDGKKVSVLNGHDDWHLPWISGAHGGALGPAETHCFDVPFEIQIAGDTSSEFLKRVGRVIDAKPGQTLQLGVVASNGNNRRNAAGTNWAETGKITFSVVETGFDELEKAPAAADSTPAKSFVHAEQKIPLDRVVWWDAGDGLEAGFLLVSPKPPNQRIPLNSLAKYMILVRNKTDKEITFLARLIPFEMADAPFVFPTNGFDRSADYDDLPEKLRASGGPPHVLEPAYVITLAPHESAIIRSQRARDELGIYVGDQNESEFPGIAGITPGMNLIVQPLQIHVPPPHGGTDLFGIAYMLTKVDRAGNQRQEVANRRAAEPGGTTIFPRIQLDVGTLNAAAVRNADAAKWGEIDRGMQCGIRPLNPKESWHIGDTLEAEILWRNVSDKDIRTVLPMRLDLYPSATDADGNHKLLDFGGRFNLRPADYTFQSGEIRSLGVVKIKLVAAGTPSPKSNFEPAHLEARPGTYLIYGSGGVSRPDTGRPTSGAIELVVADEDDHREPEKMSSKSRVMTELIKAVRDCDVDTVRRVVEQDPERVRQPIAGHDRGETRTLLHLLMPGDGREQAAGHLEIAKLLIDNGADVNALGNGPNLGTCRPLTIAAWGGHVDLMKLLIERGAILNGNPGCLQESPLHAAARHGHSGAVEFLVAAGADYELYELVMAGLHDRVNKELETNPQQVNELTSQASTLLHAALETGKGRKLIPWLLKHGADPSLTDSNGRTPLLMAIENQIWRNQDEAIAELRKLTPQPVDESQKIFVATGLGDIEQARKWLKETPKLAGSKQADGTTPLFHAVVSGDTNIVKLLLDAGADPSPRSDRFWCCLTPLHLALQTKQDGIAALLVENGADVDAHGDCTRRWQPTPLHVAARWRGPDQLRLLLDSGADMYAGGDGSLLGWITNRETLVLLLERDLDRKHPEAKTLLHRFAERGQVELVKTLVDNGWDTATTNGQGLTAEEVALANGHADAARIIRDADRP